MGNNCGIQKRDQSSSAHSRNKKYLDMAFKFQKGLIEAKNQAKEKFEEA